MTVERYQRIYEISQTTPDDIERVAWMICFIFGKTEEEVNDLTSIQFLNYADKIGKRLEIKEPPLKTIRLQTDASKITFGQFIECNYWLKNSPVEVAHLVAASLIKPLIKRTHQEQAERMLKADIGSIFSQVNTFVKSLNELIRSYKGLFEIQDNQEEEQDKPHPFLEQYGWLYSAKQIAEYEGIPLEQAYNLPVIQALNGLSYLKGKAMYDKHLSKQ
jgi:hypothetical protein